jgi:hypothetical protein
MMEDRRIRGMMSSCTMSPRIELGGTSVVQLNGTLLSPPVKVSQPKPMYPLRKLNELRFRSGEVTAKGAPRTPTVANHLTSPAVG